jgi:hypothetical protein
MRASLRRDVRPVINPLSRYRHAQRAPLGANRGKPEIHHPAPGRLLAQSEQHGREEQPMLALERGVRLKPAGGLFQGRGDGHDYGRRGQLPGNEPQRFVASYRKASGEITLGISTPSAMRGARRPPRPATCSSAWPPSCTATSNGLIPKRYPRPPVDRGSCVVVLSLLTRVEIGHIRIARTEMAGQIGGQAVAEPARIVRRRSIAHAVVNVCDERIGICVMMAKV